MATTSRATLQFNVVYSKFVEEKIHKLNERIDKSINFLQIFLGAAVMTQYAPITIGIFIAVIAYIQLVWQFGVRGVKAEASLGRWEALNIKFNGLSTADIEKEILEISKQDSKPIPKGVKLAAFKDAADQLGCPHNQQPPMTKWHKFVAFCAE